MQDILKRILATCALWPDRSAFLFADRAISYRMLGAAVSSAAAMIERLAPRRDHAVGILIEDPARHIMVALALAKAGYCSASLTPGVLENCARLRIHTILCDAPRAQQGIACHVVDSGWFTQPAPHRAIVAPPPADHVTRVEFTSGSTGWPKALGLVNQAVLAQTLNRIQAYAIESRSALCMFRVASNVGFGFALACLVQGRTLCFSDTNDGMIELINHHRIECIGASPVQMKALVSRIAALGKTMHDVREIILAGSLVSKDELANIRACFGARVTLDYGASETGPTAIAAGRLLESESFAGSAFTPLQDCEISAGASGAVGGLRIRSSGMAWPFQGDLRQTEESRGDGWFYPGDAASLTPEGLLLLAGRTDDLINLGGAKHPPEYVEAILRRHPLISDAAVAHGRQSGADHVTVLAVATGALTLSALRRWMQEECPALMIEGLLLVNEVPKTASGKIDRVTVRERTQRTSA